MPFLISPFIRHDKSHDYYKRVPPGKKKRPPPPPPPLIPAPVITSATTASGEKNAPFTYQITATNTPTSYGADPLPTGLTVSTTTGLISGTPTVFGDFFVTIHATNAGGTGSATLTLHIIDDPPPPPLLPPVITSATSASGITGTPFSYQITATHSPTSYSATPLPAGLSVNTSTGLITGTPTVAATTATTISATNADGTGTAVLTITITLAPPPPPNPPVITSLLIKSGNVGVALTYQITATNLPDSYGATGLPAGLTVNTVNGLITGTPTTAGVSNVSISATNAGGTGSATLVITIGPPPPPPAPVITSPLTATGKVGTSFSYQITATNSPTSYNATGLPTGLSVSTVTGIISGTPTVAAITNVTISATNSGGTGSATLVITVDPADPPPPPGMPRGIISLSTANGIASDTVLYQRPQVGMVLCAVPWYIFEPSEGVYNYTALETELGRIKTAGKKALFGIATGGDSQANGGKKPNWLYALGIPMFQFLNNDVPPLVISIPPYFNQTFVDKKKAAYAALGAHFGGDTDIALVAGNYANALTEDWQVPSSQQPDSIGGSEESRWLALGYTHAKMAEAARQVTNSIMSAFPNAHLRMVLGNINNPHLEPNGQFALSQEITDNARALWGTRFVLGNNQYRAISGAPSFTTDNPPNCGQDLWHCYNDPGFRMLGGSNPNGYTDDQVMRMTFDQALSDNVEFLEVYHIDALNLPGAMTYGFNLFFP